MTDNKRVTNKQILDVLGELKMKKNTRSALSLKVEWKK